MDKKKILFFILIAVILFAAVWLRISYINTDFWYDEACSWFSAKKDFPFGIMENLLHLDLQHTPLYFFLLHFWMKFFGESEVAIRSLSVIFGIATVPLAFIVAKKVLSKTLAYIAGAIVAVSPILCFFSVEARMYPMIVFLVLVGVNYLVDFEKGEGNIKSLVKLVITNLIIPYTFVGGIFYNLAVGIFYGKYLFDSNRKKFHLYKKGLIFEAVGLVPYFILISYYAKMRTLFIIKHEGSLAFSSIVEAIRNFFGATLVDNLYWPAVSAYKVDFLFAILVIVPCVYFVYGIVQGLKNSDGFLKVLYKIFISVFCAAIVVAAMHVNVFTVRYILYLVPMFLILGVAGLSNKISQKHLMIFSVFFIFCSIVFNTYFATHIKALKTRAFRAIQYEAKELKLGADDVIIMPFGADAPYYFRTSDTPRVFDFDFHKQARNPYNDKLYDKSQQKELAGKGKYNLIYDAVYQNRIFSENFYNYFVQNVNMSVPSGRYVLMALFSTDASSLVDIEELRKSIGGVRDIEENTVDILLKKFSYDMRYLLSYDFIPVKTYPHDDYTYILYQKK